MRFDDMLATLLAQPLPDAPARAAAWRQIVDVLAQGHGDEGADMFRAYDLLRQLRAQVPAGVRAEAARALAGRRVPADLVALFAEEPAQIAASMIGEAMLPTDDWLALLPVLTPTGRGLLRHRRDLPREVVQALGSFGAADFVIEAPAYAAVELEEEPPLAALFDDEEDEVPQAPEAPVVEGEQQIRDLLKRIEAFRTRAKPVVQPVMPAEEPSARIGDFRFETGPDGIIRWVEGAPRGALIGETIAVAASSADHGVDAHVVGAFKRRAPFRDARLSIMGDGVASGEWRISGVPFFQPRDGRFTGYRGTARRPRADETAVTAAGDPGVFGTGMPAESLRQLVHELRTPLNAIVGFSEMIERQYRGPAASAYRTRAADIIAQGKRLLAAVDDLDVAARLQSRSPEAEDGTIDATAMLTRLHADYLPVAEARGVTLKFRIAAGLPEAAADPVAAERMFARLVAATIATAERGETVAADLTREEGALLLGVTRPRLLAGRDERMLLDPGYTPDSDWNEGDWPDAPVLGLGFALRLVRNLATAAGGALDISEDRFLLRLPIRTAAAPAGETPSLSN